MRYFQDELGYPPDQDARRVSASSTHERNRVRLRLSSDNANRTIAKRTTVEFR